MKRKFSILVLLFVSPICAYKFKYVSYTGPSMKTWREAQSFCRERHTDLAVVRNYADNQMLMDSRGWIGLHRHNNTAVWKWSRGFKSLNFLSWADDEPKKDEHCAFKISAQLLWRSEQCDEIHSFLCFDENVVLVQRNKTWEEALDHCRSLWRQGNPSRKLYFDLSTVISQDGVSKALEMALYATTDEVWTGLRFLAGHWWWAGGEPAELKHICPTVESCGTLDKSGNLKISNCEERRNFICDKIRR